MSLSAEDKLAIHELLSRSAYAFDQQDLLFHRPQAVRQGQAERGLAFTRNGRG